MPDNADRPENLLLVEYTDKVDEINLNLGFKDNYFGEEKIPVLFIFSNFPSALITNKQILVGSIRTYVEERKGIFFFPSKMKEDVKQFVLEALRKEKLVQYFLPYSGNKYNPVYLSHICNTCFSIKNINLQKVVKIGNPTIQQTKNIKRIPHIHLEIFKELAKSEDREVTFFIIDKEEMQIIESLNLEKKPSVKRETRFNDLVKDRVFKTRFFDLFSGENSAPERIKRIYGGKNWKFHSVLIFYSSRHKRVFIQDLPESAFFMDANDTTFIGLNTQYSLLNYDYKEIPDQRITITMNNTSKQFDILIDDKLTDRPDIKRDIMNTFPDCAESVNQFLHMITYMRFNEARFYFDKMAVFLKIVGNKYSIDTYEAKNKDYP